LKEIEKIAKQDGVVNLATINKLREDLKLPPLEN
jgi:hypothetical protein